MECQKGASEVCGVVTQHGGRFLSHSALLAMWGQLHSRESSGSKPVGPRSAQLQEQQSANWGCKALERALEPKGPGHSHMLIHKPLGWPGLALGKKLIVT